MSLYTPPFNQALLGNPWSDYELPEYAEALFFAIKEEMERVYWNREQKSWDGYINPNISDITWRSYCWDEDSPEATLPNFVFGEVEIRWYKYIGRGMTTNVDWTPDRWVEWFDGCMACVRKADPPLYEE